MSTMNTMSAMDWFERAKKVIPGGVNSPVRAFKAVGGTPRFIERGEGARIYDSEGRSYVDFVGSWGPLILGHAFPPVIEAVKAASEKGLGFGAATFGEVEMAELICSLTPSVEMARLTSSGTEAAMSAIRVARGATGKTKVIKFEGCYHGHSDSLLVKAGSGAMTAGIPDSEGVPAGCANDTLTAPFNDIDAVAKLFEVNKGEIAAVITELLPANMGVVFPKDGFLQKLKTLCGQNGALFIADEVITGFRLGTGGAQEYFGIKADLSTYGKIIGGGMAVGAYGGRRELMEHVAPCGGVYQAGTLSGNPVAVAAGMTQLRYLRDHPEVYGHIDGLSEMLSNGLAEIAEKYGVPVCGNRAGSLSSLFFTDGKVESYTDAKKSDTGRYSKFFNAMLNQGVYFAPAQFEAAFLSYAHTKEDIEFVLDCAENAMKGL